MSRNLVYKCDAAGKEIGRKMHITLMVSQGRGTGIAVPVRGDGWRTTQAPVSTLLNFHGTNCIARYFSKLIEKAEKEWKPDMAKHAEK